MYLGLICRAIRKPHQCKALALTPFPWPICSEAASARASAFPRQMFSIPDTADYPKVHGGYSISLICIASQPVAAGIPGRRVSHPQAHQACRSAFNRAIRVPLIRLCQTDGKRNRAAQIPSTALYPLSTPPPTGLAPINKPRPCAENQQVLLKLSSSWPLQSGVNGGGIG